jgi:vitamin B12 transporter
MQKKISKTNLLRCTIAAISAASTPFVSAALQDINLPINNLSAGPTLDTVVVTASRQPVPLREVAASVSVLTADDIAISGQSNVGDLLRALPGVNVSNNGGIGKTSALRIRGEESFRTLVLVDGMNISDPTAPQVSPRFEDLLSNGIERIEVLRGPQGMMYGADAGGIVNITTRRAHEPFAADAAAEYGSYGTSNLFANVRGKNDSADYSLSATHFDTTGFNARSTDTVNPDKDGYTNTTLHFNGGAQISDEFRVETTIRNVRAENEYDGCSDSVTFLTTHNCINYYNLTAYRVAAIYDTAKFLQKVALQRSLNEREDFSNGVGGGRYNGDIDEGQYEGIFRIASAGDLVYGADLKQEALKQQSERKTDRDQLGYYAEWQGHIDKQFFYTAGARHDNNDDFGDHTSYRTSAAYVIDTVGGDSLKLKTSYGTGFRAPSLYEIAYNAGPFASPPASSIKLREETSKGLDVGFEYHWKNAGYVEVVYFDQSIYNEITFDLVDFSGYLQSNGATHSRGIEIGGIYPLTQSFQLIGNYTYDDTEDPNHDQRIRRPRHIANVGFDLQPGIESVTIRTNLRVVKDTEDQVSGVGRLKLDDYSALEASINWTVNSQLDLYVRGENLLNDNYQEVTTYNTPKSSVYGGVRYHFR